MKICLECSARFSAPDLHCQDCGYAPPVVDGFTCLAPALINDEEGFDERIFECFAGINKNHFILSYRNRLVIAAIRKYFMDAALILEAGCGTGMVLDAIVRAFPEKTIHASEVSLSGLQATRRTVNGPNLKLFQMDARQIPFDGEYDMVGMFDVLEHIEDDRGVMKNVHRSLSPNGGLLITVPQHPSLWGPADEAVHHKRRYTRPEMVDKLTTAGFRVLRMTSYNFFLLPAMMVNRYIQKDNYDITKEWELNPAVNAALLAVSRIENLLIDLGLDFPLGGSLFCVARKD